MPKSWSTHCGSGVTLIVTTRSDGSGHGSGLGEGLGDGEADGDGLGLAEGLGDGEADGDGLGLAEGLGDGEADGDGLGLADGLGDGEADGDGLGLADGLGDGEADGDGLGLGDGLVPIVPTAFSRQTTSQKGPRRSPSSLASFWPSKATDRLGRQRRAFSRKIRLTPECLPNPDSTAMRLPEASVF